MSRLFSIIIPVYNEAEILAASVAEVHNHLSARQIEHEIIIVSNGSTDRTSEIGHSLSKSQANVVFLELPERGAGRAFVQGVKAARGDCIATLDVDLSSELIFLDYAYDLLRYADMVVGSKTMGNQKRSAIRVCASQLYILLSNLAFNVTISDYSIGSKAFRREAILGALPFLDPWTGHIFELCLYLHCHKRKVVQIGIDCQDLRRSRFNLLHEGLYRYTHLWRCWRKLKDRNSWFFQDA
ncbi:MAG: glycosyltransferase family 2 protein [Deltaproteobacteria bacterium]|nr:glycosyltransferase family 2 protein [Deltaproteobacteria bacterium]